jgi:hypothetical protein
MRRRRSWLASTSSSRPARNCPSSPTSAPIRRNSTNLSAPSRPSCAATSDAAKRRSPTPPRPTPAINSNTPRFQSQRKAKASLCSSTRLDSTATNFATRPNAPMKPLPASSANCGRALHSGSRNNVFVLWISGGHRAVRRSQFLHDATTYYSHAEFYQKISTFLPFPSIHFRPVSTAIFNCTAYPSKSFSHRKSQLIKILL